MLDRFQSPRIARIVDEGRVMCPVRLVDIDVERCASCSFLDEAKADAHAGPAEIVCRPSLRALVRVADQLS